MTEHSNFEAGGSFYISINGGEWEKADNLVVDQGLNYILNASLLGQSVLTSFFLAPFNGNVTPAASLTAATFAATTTEFTNYDESTRPAYVPNGASTAKLASNSAAPGLITVAGGAQTAIYGCALISSSVKGGTAGVLIAAARFATPKTGLGVGDEIRLKYEIGASST